MQTLSVGDIVAERYQLLSLLGAGSQGAVFRARQDPLGREVALKSLSGGNNSGLQTSTRFRREAEALARLAHPCCVRVFDFGIWQSTPYLVMELVQGVALSTALRGLPWPAERAIHIGFQIARGLSHAHASGIVHRDLSPSNVMLLAEDEDQEGVRVKLVDFGLARFHEDGHGSLSGQVYGTPSYLSPERIRGGAGTPACDVYATGVILFEMLTGFHPLRRSSGPATAAAVLEQGMPSLHDIESAAILPPSLCDLIDRCTARRPEDRLADGMALRRGLAEVREQLDTQPARARRDYNPEISYLPTDVPDRALEDPDSEDTDSVEEHPVPQEPSLDRPAPRAPRPSPKHPDAPPLMLYAVAGAVTAVFLVVLLLGIGRLAGIL